MEPQKNKKSLIGTVISNNMDKTIVVTIERIVKHSVYGKYIRRTSKCYAHDPQNKCQVGDVVRVEESRPLSRKKRWQLVEVLDR
ncbi:MAG: 30S ribosomal protein S17 [Candidatus Marinimicrobia bacterium]|nr:30S ribosomal protein S17 [bacterium]MCG2716521.1 30S ribosomal protein S17 [Candidatus Neomarinimicrobiota bacterium]